MQNPDLDSPGIEAKRERLYAAMTKRLGHEPIRSDIDALDEPSLDRLLRHYGAGTQGLVW